MFAVDLFQQRNSMQTILTKLICRHSNGVLAFCVVMTLFSGVACAAAPNREMSYWAYLPTNLIDKKKAFQATELADALGRFNYDGLVVADVKLMMLERFGYDRPGSHYDRRVKALLQACEDNNVEFIPSIVDVSRAVSILAVNPNLAAGYPVIDAVFEVQDGLARVVPDADVDFIGHRFDDPSLNFSKRGGFRDRPGQAVVPDKTIKRKGQGSLRLNAAKAHLGSMCRISEIAQVKPRHAYRVSAWVRTAGMEPVNRFNFVVEAVVGKEKRRLTYDAPAIHQVKKTQDWQLVSTVFNSLSFDRVQIMAGFWGVRRGHAWIDDLRVEQLGLVNVLRRSGCPLQVKLAETGTVLVEGEDFDPVRDPELGQAGYPGKFDRYHKPVPIRMRKKLPDGTRLLVSYYHPCVIGGHQVDACMTEPEVYQILDRQIERLDRYLGQPRTYHVGLDELRTGASCAACRKTEKTPGQLLASCVERLQKLIHKHNPQARIVIWADMFDPAQNAVDRYHLFEGTLAGSWKGLDRETIVCQWRYKTRAQSLAFFEKLGQPIVCSIDIGQSEGRFDAYMQDWLKVIKATSGVEGVMYTAWRHDYRFIGDFVQLVEDATRRD
jgi:hypothetical protein